MDYLPGLEFTEKEQSRLDSKDFLSILMGDRFISTHEQHIKNSIPMGAKINRNNLSQCVELYMGNIKKKYYLYVTVLGWEEKEFKTILWNMAEDDVSPFISDNWQKYDIKYVNQELNYVLHLDDKGGIIDISDTDDSLDEDGEEDIFAFLQRIVKENKESKDDDEILFKDDELF